MEVGFAQAALEADRAAGLVAGLGCRIEQRMGAGVGLERLFLGDPNACQHAQPIGTGQVAAFFVDRSLQLLEGAEVAAWQHVQVMLGGIRELHGLGAVLVSQGVEFRLLEQVHRRTDVVQGLVERTQEDEHVVGA
ncbi:hypothetical protein D3C76_1490920 [compost metagenome]